MVTADHPVLVEARLREAAEPLQIEYPANYKGIKSNPDAAAIFIGTTPAYYYESELEVARKYCQTLNYAQGVILTGAVKSDDDPLMAADTDTLDGIEIANGMESTRSLADGTDRAMRDRVMMIRERGYRGGLPPKMEAPKPISDDTEAIPRKMEAPAPAEDKKSSKSR